MASDNQNPNGQKGREVPLTSTQRMAAHDFLSPEFESLQRVGGTTRPKMTAPGRKTQSGCIPMVDPNVKVAELGSAAVVTQSGEIASPAGIAGKPVMVHKSTSRSRIEGTNEIYVKSAIFDALLDDPESQNTSNAVRSVSDNKVKLQAPVLQASSAPDENRSNCFGIVSSGILPCVELDKSFDSPCLDENMIEPNRMGTQTAIKMMAAEANTEEVFVSRIDGKNSDFSQKNAESSSLGKARSQQSGDPQKLFGLPLPSMQACALHPEDNNGAEAPVELCRRFAIEHLYDTRLTDLLRAEVDESGLDADLDALLVQLVDISESEHPKVIYLDSECTYGSYRLLRAFLKRCGESMSQFSCYTSAQSPECNPYDLITALVSSRVGCFPDDPEDARNDSIVRGGVNLFNPTDLKWGLDILFVRYGLTMYLSSQRDLPTLKSRNESDLFEVLLNMIQRDASRGPVVIAISEEYIRPYYAWTDIIRQIRAIHSPNILVLVSSLPEDESEMKTGDEIFRCSPLQTGDVRLLLENVLSTYKIPAPLMARFAERAGSTFTDVRRSVYILRNEIRNYAQNPAAFEAALNQLPDNSADRAVIYYNSLENDQRHFLCVASLMNERFYLNDLIHILALEPLPDEIPWHRNLRNEWAKKVANSLVKLGELIPLSEDPRRGTRYMIPEANLFCEFSDDPVAERHIRGCYAHLVEREKADPCEIAVAFENADLWANATHYWLQIARHLGDAFYNRSAYTILATCLCHIGPEYDSLFVQLLTACTDQVMRMGHFDEAATYAEILARYGYLSEDKEQSCRAFIMQGKALRVQGEFARSREVLLNSIKMAESLNDDTLICNAYYGLAELLYDAGEKGSLVNALRYAEKALEVCRRQSNLVKLAEVLTLCARIYLLRGEPERARQAANEAYQALQVSGGWYNTPYPLCILAECASALNEPLPLDNVERGFEVADKTGDVCQQFRLLVTRVKLMVNTLQKQAVRADLAAIDEIVTRWPYKPWIAQYQLLLALFDFSRKNFAKTTHSLKTFFETATSLGNAYLMSQGYALSAELNFEVYRRQLGSISLEKTEKLYHSATNIYESLGAWHHVAETQRNYADFLEYMNRAKEAEAARNRADKVDPYCQ